MGSNSGIKILTLVQRDLLFKTAVFLLPFENFFFAPSRGWGAIAPILFCVYCIVNLPHLKESILNQRRILAFIAALVLITSLNFFVFPPDLKILMDVSRALLLGILFFISLDLHFNVHNRNPEGILKILTAAYGLCLVTGLIQVVALKFNITPLLNAHEWMAKRSTLVRQSRIQFTFTEPAFIAMHVYGVLLPLLVVFRGYKQASRLKLVFFAITVVALFWSESARFLVDSVVIAVLYCIFRMPWRNRRVVAVACAAAVVLAFSSVLFYKSHPRIKNVVTTGIYGDGSLASRYFRINASLIGYAKNKIAVLTGHGLSNIWYPFTDGYQEARAQYKSTYVREVENLKTKKPSSLLCMPVRIISELGIVVFAVILVLLFDRKHTFLYLVLIYIYLSFDSYAFYSVWIYLFFIKTDTHPGHDQIACVNAPLS